MTAMPSDPAADPAADLAAESAAGQSRGTRSSRGSRSPKGPRGPLTWLLDVFSSIWLGVTLMIIIFVYSSIGSAGLPVHWNILEPASWKNVRELIEMSEFQWFHWWPFDLMIALFCINLTVATIRRIPFNRMNLGVWMIHTGLIVLAIGSVIYFTLKREGDAPVPRRQVVIQVPGAEPATMVASPGNELIVGRGMDAWRFRVASITPDWELLSGDDKGTRAYKVTMDVRSPDGNSFMRELIDGFPQYTEDLVRNADAAAAGSPPFARAINTIGRRIVDDSVQLALEPVMVDRFWLMETRAIHLREVGSDTWVERPVPWMPMFQDHVRDMTDVWTVPGDQLDPVRPIRVSVPAVSPDDPLPGVDFTITDYLRYAVMQERRLPGGEQLDPAAAVRLTSRDGTSQVFELAAFDAEDSSALRGALSFHWAADEEAAQRWLSPVAPTIRVVMADGTTEDVPVDRTARMDPNLAYRPVPGTSYEWRVEAFEDGLEFEPGRSFSVAIVGIRDGSRTYTRWVFDDPALTRDVPEGGSIADHVAGTVDPGITLAYRPGTPVAIRLVAGPEEDRLRISVPQPGAAAPRAFEIQPRQPVLMPGDLQLVVERYAPRTRVLERPLIIPRKQRDRDVGMMASMIRLEVPVGSGPRPIWQEWMPYHLYAFQSKAHAIRRFRYEPSVLELPDGRRIEMKFSRQTAPLDEAVRLKEFEVVARIGGFQGDTSSIRDWRSMVSFSDGEGGWTETVPVHMNNPKQAGQYWFFQAQWDPPDQPRFTGDPGSAGLNYTVLGVGNRHGVNVQLAGSIISVIGLMYAFYVKPWLRRRQLIAAYAAAGFGAEEAKAMAAAGTPPTEAATATATATTAGDGQARREPATAGEERS